MNIAVNKLFRWVAAAALGFGLIAQPALAQDVPANEFVEKFSNEVLAEIKARKQELLADPKKLDALIDQKVMPNVNFRRMTQLVVGRPWREATPEQREQITKEFRTLLVKTYSGALAQVGDQTLQVDRLRARPEDTDVIVNSRVIQKGAPPVDLAYRVEKKDGKWLIYDLSVLGLWLVDSYKAQFGTVLSNSGVDGLIQTLKTLNAKG
ncbi:phospholipid-binding protein MlaC [Limnobacter sp.]|uniref:MlaC/ttg2D family ABC transporter substrate-binding protein n=1 Tax=Limnobacter sp. TaxID=2003368 RepID=UPI0025C0D506|nr:ABC transporter substrate-binding protein [Limnobacter sp.]